MCQNSFCNDCCSSELKVNDLKDPEIQKCRNLCMKKIKESNATIDQMFHHKKNKTTENKLPPPPPATPVPPPEAPAAAPALPEVPVAAPVAMPVMPSAPAAGGAFKYNLCAGTEFVTM